MKNNDFYKLGLNIKGLRKFYGLTQEEVALAVGVSKQAISQYELGESIPERNILLDICKYFRITEDELLNGNYDNMKSITKAPVHDKKYQLEMFDKLLPLVCSEVALENKYFKDAYEIHQDLYRALMREGVLDEVLLNKCLDLYDKPFEDGIVEGIANSLWWILFFGFAISLTSPQLCEKGKLLQNNKISFKEFLKEGFLQPVDMDTQSEEYKEFEVARVEFLKENEVQILVKIRQLKLSKEYSDLGDYYLSFIYLFNLIRNTESPEMNKAVGFEMLNTFSLLGNPYTQKFSDKPEKTQKSKRH